MLTAEEDESTYQVHYKSYVTPLIFLCIPPLILFELGPSVLDDTIKTGELVGLLIGILLPLLGAYYFLEFANFTFSRADDLFHWRYSGLHDRKLDQIVDQIRDYIGHSSAMH
jgi:hypothetical protein